MPTILVFRHTVSCPWKGEERKVLIVMFGCLGDKILLRRLIVNRWVVQRLELIGKLTLSVTEGNSADETLYTQPQSCRNFPQA